MRYPGAAVFENDPQVSTRIACGRLPRDYGLISGVLTRTDERPVDELTISNGLGSDFVAAKRQKKKGGEGNAMATMHMGPFLLWCVVAPGYFRIRNLSCCIGVADVLLV